ncbi:MAG: hypothetical protein ACI9FB_000232 [Candidatus Azotimanducaceae bacterium]|jgi:hypothetical protein
MLPNDAQLIICSFVGALALQYCSLALFRLHYRTCVIHLTLIDIFVVNIVYLKIILLNTLALHIVINSTVNITIVIDGIITYLFHCF